MYIYVYTQVFIIVGTYVLLNALFMCTLVLQKNKIYKLKNNSYIGFTKKNINLKNKNNSYAYTYSSSIHVSIKILHSA